MTPTIRSAQPGDVPVLVEIEHLCFPDPSWEARDFLQYSCYVAELEGRIVGFLVAQFVIPGNHHESGECEILNLAVVPVARGLGIATALLNHLVRPDTRYFLEVRESNVPARNLYQRLGFTEIGSRADYYDNPPETAIVMAKK